MKIEEIEKKLDNFVEKLKDRDGLYYSCQAKTPQGCSVYNGTDNGEFKKSIELYEKIKELKPFDKYEEVVKIIYDNLGGYSPFKRFCES